MSHGLGLFITFMFILMYKQFFDDDGLNDNNNEDKKDEMMKEMMSTSIKNTFLVRHLQ